MSSIPGDQKPLIFGAPIQEPAEGGKRLQLTTAKPARH